ncbi:MAG: rhomboid family intrarane serine protease [Solirubrobacterales bacterium]|nr:rhomboid family intrarane serine protease [Solirubrobacterales bacterium]
MFPLKDNLPTRNLPVVTILFIALNVIAYLVLQPKTGIDFSGDSLDQNALFHYAAVPYELTHLGEHCAVIRGGGAVRCAEGIGNGGIATVVTLFTAMFTHAGLLHLGGNMLFLWIFGNNIEDSMGRVRFVAFYLLGGLAATGLQVAIAPDEIVPTLGASGAVAGVLGGYILLHPRAKVVTLVFVILFFTILELPAIVFLGIWFAQQALFGALDLTSPAGDGGGVAYFAHIGGFAFGLLAIRLFARRHDDLTTPRSLAS